MNLSVRLKPEIEQLLDDRQIAGLGVLEEPVDEVGGTGEVLDSVSLWNVPVPIHELA